MFKCICLIVFLLGSTELRASIHSSENLGSLDLGPFNLTDFNIDSEEKPLDIPLDTLYIELRNEKVVKLYPGQYLKVRSGFKLTEGTIHKLYPSYLMLENGEILYMINYSNATSLKIMNPKKGIRVLGSVVSALAYPVAIVVAIAYPGDIDTIEIAGFTGVAAGLGFLYSGDRLRGKRICLKRAKIIT